LLIALLGAHNWRKGSGITYRDGQVSGAPPCYNLGNGIKVVQLSNKVVQLPINYLLASKLCCSVTFITSGY
jgi:hypothetical protein